MGVFFYTKSVALIEDVPLSEEYNGIDAESELRRGCAVEMILMHVGINKIKILSASIKTFC